RIQVEHRVSELVSGIDIVREAIRVAQGNPLSLRQDQITLQGAAVEVRIKAVNPDRRDAQGRPQAAPGRIDLLRVLGTNDFKSLESQGVYIETSVFEGDSVNPHADPMIMKILVTGQNRQEALSRMRNVLEHTTLEGSQGFHSDLLRNRRLLETQRARSGDYDNRFVDRWTKLGGEDRSALRHREQHSILGNSHRPFIHLEITREGAITNERSEELERAVSDLLDLSQSETSNTLHGLLAERFSDSSFRSAFLNETQSQNLRVRAQVDSTGHLRQISLFSNQKPVRQLIVSEGRVSYNDVEPTSILYDVDFSRSENPAQGQVTLYRRGVSKPVFQGGIESHPDQASLYRIFPRTGVELQLRVMKSAFQTSHQYNDRAGNLISFVSSTEVNENYTQRLLSLMEQSSLNNPLPIREEASRNIHVILDTIASDSPQSSRRQEAMRELCQTPATLIGTLLRWMRETKNISTRQFLDEVLAQRELRDYDITYRTLDAHNAEARFSETEGPIRLIRHYSPEGESLQEAIQSAFSHLDRESETTQSVRIILRRAESEINEDALSAEFQQASREILERNPTLASAREISLIVERNGSGAYPNFYTFKPNSDRIYQEDLRLRNLHPNDQIEFWRLGHFNTRRLMNHSDRFVHIYEGRHAASKDHRLFGHVVIPEAHAERDSSGALVGIPLIEAGVTHLIRSMQSSLNEMPTSERPSWNRIFINIPPVMRISGNEAENFAIHLAEKYSDAFRSLHLEKVVVRARLQDDRAPGGYRDVLIRVQNPSGYAYESRLDTIVEGYLEGNNTTRSILLRNGHYERWLQNPAHLFRAREASPADLTIQPLTPVEQRRQKERSKGGIFAYDLPALLHREAQQFREGLLLRQGTTETHSNRRSIFDSLRPESGRWNDGFVELDLDPQSLRIDPRTQQLDYNHGDFIPAMDKSNPNETRPMGQNEAGIVIGIKTDDLGIGIPVRRLVLMGDLTYFRNAIVNGEKLREGLGSLSARECTRIIASIRYAAREGIPIDWFTASSGAEIHPERGVEGLDATAAVVREIVLHAHSQGVRMNMVVHDTNIGAQSYWNSLASILHDTGGTLIMTKRGNMALTGADAWTAAMIPNIHSEDLPAKSKYFYPQGLRTLAGYTEVHGPNSEAMAGVENTREAIQLLLRHHYYTYARAGELVSLRSLGAQDPHDRDITQAVSLEGLDGRTITRRVGDEIRSILEGRGGNREAILNSLRDVGSPAPVPWWQNAVGVRGQEPGNGLMPQRFGSLIQEIQIGGQPTLAIFPPVGPLTPADSDIIARAIWKANERLPVLLIGSLSGFNGDPRSMQNRQLTYGARIAEAIVRFKGPITIVNMGYIVGGTKVVVSNQLNPHLTAIALEGAHETVVGGALYGKVVSRSRVREEAGLDPRMPGASEEIRREIIREIENRKGQTFADHHSVERARQVGAISEVIPASALRPTIIRIQREVRARFEENQRQQNSQITIHAANAGPVRSLLQSLGLPFREDPSGNLIVGMEVFQRLLANGHSDRGE
ncbi:MAG: hypothetical protein JNK65_02125, partial [Deltaproteobacteria bacterium]|nr:hypothetical protein [Deltaproteobacteria bacterium]